MATSPLSKAIDKFEDAFPGRPYFIDVDTYYHTGDTNNEAKEAWAELAKRPADVAVWHELLGAYPNAKPRTYEHASTPKNRIDYPTDSGWVIARDNDSPVSFQAAAKRIIEKSKKRTGGLGIWGEQLIEGAAAGQAFAIDSMPKIYSARINNHLHRQAFYGHLPPPEALDEAWSDDV